MWEQTYDPPPQDVITGDNIKTSVNPLIFFRVVDPLSYIAGAEKTKQMVISLAETIIRDRCGTKTFEAIRGSTEELGKEIANKLNEASLAEEEKAKEAEKAEESSFNWNIKGWGIKVTRVKLQGIDPPQNIVQAIEKKFIAEKEGEAEVVKAEKEYQAKIKRVEAEAFGVKEKGKATGEAISAQVDALNRDGGDLYTAIEVSKSMKEGDKVIFTDDALKGVTGAILNMFLGKE